MMDILESLKQEHSKKQTDRIVTFPAFRSRAKQALREMEKANPPQLK